MEDISGLGSETTILKRPPLLSDYKVEYVPTGTFVGFAETLLKGYLFGIKGKRKITASFDFKNRAELNEFVDFWRDRKGSYKRFWIICWQNEFELAEEVKQSDTFVKIVDCELKNRYDGNLRIFIITKSGDFIIRHVTEVDKASNNQERLIVDTQMPINILPGDVAMFGRVLLVRFQDNCLETKFTLADESEVYATTTVSFIELPHEYKEV